MNAPTPRESQFLSLIRRHGPLSRKELHEKTNLRPNTVGEIAAAMLESGLLREGESESVGVGRPRQLLEIDPARLHIVGIALEPGKVSACRLNLQGEIRDTIRQQSVGKTDDLVAVATALAREFANDQTLGVGMSITGFVDTQTRSILTSSATLRQSPTRLDSVYAAIGDHPVVVENDMHARATYWLLNQDGGGNEAITRQDILLIDLGDGAIGAALLVGGRPNRGCVVGANELGHTRFFVETDVCFCGQTGCLERIFSSPFLQRTSGDPKADLQKHLLGDESSDEAVDKIAGYVAAGIANAINFIRADRVVIAGRVLAAVAFCQKLLGRVRKLLLPPLAERVHIGLWDKKAIDPAEAAAWLSLADVYRGGQVEEWAVHTGVDHGADVVAESASDEAN